MSELTINGVIGSTFRTPENQKLLFERDLGEGHLHILTVPGGKLYRVENPETGELEIPDTAWFEREIASGGLVKISDENGPVSQARSRAKARDRVQMLKEDPFVEARLALVNGLLERGIDPNDPAFGQAIDDIWTSELQANMSGRVPRRKGLDPEVEAIVQEERRRYWQYRGFKLVDIYAAVLTRIKTENLRRVADGQTSLTMPGKETIRRRVHEMECRDTYAEKFGEKAARRKYDGSGNGINASRILQIGLMDDAVVDLVTCLDADRGMVAGRPYLTVLIDV
ncbi:hypothetical protein A4X03_0g9961, partial [Tilletia caries]